MKGIYSTTEGGHTGGRTEVVQPAHNEYRSEPNNEISDMKQNKTNDVTKTINKQQQMKRIARAGKPPSMLHFSKETASIS